MKQSPFEPEHIDVMCADGQPSRLIFRKKQLKVCKIINLWRIDDTWWQKPVTRIYYALELESGTRITVFHDIAGDRWYRQNWTT